MAIFAPAESLPSPATLIDNHVLVTIQEIVIIYLDCCNIGRHMCTQRDQRDAKKGYCAKGETGG